MANKDLPLKVELVGGVLTITIGVSALCGVAVEGPAFPPQPTVTDEFAFVRAIVAMLQRDEDFDGVTPVHRLLHAAAVEAVEGGADGVRFPGDV